MSEGYYRATLFWALNSRNPKVFHLWGEYSSLFTGQVSEGRNVLEECSFPPGMPGRRLLSKRIPDKPAAGVISEVAKSMAVPTSAVLQVHPLGGH